MIQKTTHIKSYSQVHTKKYVFLFNLIEKNSILHVKGRL